MGGEGDMDPRQQHYQPLYQNHDINSYGTTSIPQYPPGFIVAQAPPPAPYAPSTAAYAHTAHTQITVPAPGPCIIVKAKFEERYKQFLLPVSSSVLDLSAQIKENFHIQSEGGASLGTAYLLWLFFGFFGVHRFYLRQHSATSFWIWLLTGQLFSFGWLYDGIMMSRAVDKYNKDILYRKSTQLSVAQHLFGGYQGERQPSMVGAYALWFFMGWMGAHRWYTGYHTASSFSAWFVTFQMCGFGWLYDAYYTSYMVRNYKTPTTRPPFFVKSYDGQHDFLPVNTNEDLCAVINSANNRDDKILRLVVASKKSDAVAHLLWFVFGWAGLHARYLNLGPNTFLIRLFTVNYFMLGWIADGINLNNMTDEANDRLAGQFVPSWEGRKHWPIRGVVASTIVDMV